MQDIHLPNLHVRNKQASAFAPNPADGFQGISSWQWREKLIN